MKHILVVDDEPQITRMLRASLQSSGYQVTACANGAEAYASFEKNHPDLVITDLAMPEMTGIDLTRAIRRVAATPIIVLSVRDTDVMKITALDEGADDYLTKPFSMPELLARIRAHLRRTGGQTPGEPRIEVGDFIIDVDTHTASVCGETVHLTPKEFNLLLILMRSQGRVLTHRVLLKSIWGPEAVYQPEYLRVLISQLRKKIERSDTPRYILSEPWVGYRFEPHGSSPLTTS